MDTVRSNKRNRLLAALFAEVKKKGIDAEFLRDVVSQNIIAKRLSEATPREIVRVLTHIAGKKNPPQSPFDKGGSEAGGFGKYESSKKGLLTELEDAAKERWGLDFQRSLNGFINSHLKIPTHYRFLNIGFLKRIKERIKEMNSQDEVA